MSATGKDPAGPFLKGFFKAINLHKTKKIIISAIKPNNRVVIAIDKANTHLTSCFGGLSL
jgi:hypothetical protein